MLRRVQNSSNFPSSFLFCFEFSHVFSLSYPFSALGLVLTIFTELFHEERKWQHDTNFLFLGRVEWSWICFPFFGDDAVEREVGEINICAPVCLGHGARTTATTKRSTFPHAVLWHPPAHNFA